MAEMPTADDIARFAESVIADAIDDWLGVYEVWWEANGLYPMLAVSQRLAIAEQVVSLILAEGWARLSRAPWKHPEQQESIPPEDWQRLLLDASTWAPATWAASEETTVFLIPTEDDRTLLWMRQTRRDGPADQKGVRGELL